MSLRRPAYIARRFGRPIGPLVAGSALVLVPWLGAALLGLLVALRSGRKAWRVPRGPFIAAILVAGAGWFVGDLDIAIVVWLAAVGVLVAVGRRWFAGARGCTTVAFTDGLVLGLVIAAAVSVAEALWHGASPFDLTYRAQAWWAHPNLWGASVLAPTVFVTGAPMARSRPGRIAVAVLAAGVVVIASGSRAALLGLFVGVAVVLISDVARRPSARARRSGAVAVMVLVVLLGLVVVDGGWRARLLGTVGIQSSVAPMRNLFQASEAMLDGVWWSPNVSVDAVDPVADTLEIHRLERVSGRWTDRLQQRVRLEPDAWYTFSADVFVEGPTDPVVAFIGWAARVEGDVEIVVRFPVGAAPEPSIAGDARLQTARAVEGPDGWRRLQVTFGLTLDTPALVELGFAPRTVEGAAAPVLVRRLQLEAGRDVGPYEPRVAPNRTSIVAWSAVRSRLDIYEVMAERVWQRPWAGWGTRGFVAASGEPGFPAPTGDHEHSLVLFMSLRYGALGLVALTVLTLTLVRHGPRAVAIVAAVGITNVVDLTFLSDAVYVATVLLVAGSTPRPTTRREAGDEPTLAGGSHR